MRTTLALVALLPACAWTGPLEHLRATLDTNDRYRQAQVNIEVAARDVTAALAVRGPQASAGAALRLDKPTAQGNDQPPDRLSPQLVVTQEIFNLGNSRAVEVAKLNLEAARQRAATARQQVMLGTYQAYLGAALAQESLSLLDRRGVQLTELLRLASTTLEVGSGTRLNVLIVKAQLAALRAERVSAAGVLATARRALTSLSGLASDNIRSLRQPLSLPTGGLEAWLAQAANAPAVRAADALVRMQGALVRQLRASILPSLELQGVTDIDSVHSLNLQLRVPLYSSGRATATIEATQLRQEALAAELAQSLTDTRLAIANAHADIKLHSKRGVALATNVAITRELLELTNAGIELRANILADALKAESDLAAAELLLLQASHAQLQAWLNLLVATGNLSLAKAGEIDGLFR